MLSACAISSWRCSISAVHSASSSLFTGLPFGHGWCENPMVNPAGKPTL